MTDPLVLLGRLVTFDPAQPMIDKGAVYIGADEKIASVQKASDPPPDGFDAARRVSTRGAIYPGLIDLQGHMAYNCLSLWSPTGVTEPLSARCSSWSPGRRPRGSALAFATCAPSELIRRLPLRTGASVSKPRQPMPAMDEEQQRRARCR
jgi:cytosine/adenosine deaminase-related metal-dependent hydrolase